MNFYQIQTLEASLFLIQNPIPIYGSSNKESCFLFQNLQIHILFENFRIWEGPLLIESIQAFLKKNPNKSKLH
jgi:hypothetical protein